MTVENATHINNLDPTYPTPSDSVSEGDNHIRLIKTAVKATFPSLTGATQATAAQMDLLTTATNANTANELVKRDASGNFNGATITAATAFVGTLTTAAQTNVTSVGALDGGSITSGFGAIDNGTSNITTTGDLAAGKATIDDVIVNGTNIGHTNDTDLIDLASGALTVNGSITTTSAVSTGGLTVAGNITMNGTGLVDGVDVAGLNTGLTSGTVADTRIANILDKVYPVGSIYMSTTKNTSPADIFGGAWSETGVGRVLVGFGSLDDGDTTETFTAGETGGKYKHTLTIAEMPSHRHRLMNGSGGASTNALSNNSGISGMNSKSGTFIDGSGNLVENTGGGTSHNNIQPYLTVYMWVRDS
jgi:hypothetical protein